MGGLDGEQKQLIKQLVNFRTKEGKRTRVRAIVYQTFHRLAQTKRDVIKLMVDDVKNVKPICEVEKVGVAGTIYDVPGIVARDRQQTLAIRWILEAAFKRRKYFVGRHRLLRCAIVHNFSNPLKVWSKSIDDKPCLQLFMHILRSSC
ncbi:hypothetical protein UlMin_021671 [Ulmus minor]